MPEPDRETSLEHELRAVSDLDEWARSELYSVREPGWRTTATRAIAASAAAETYRVIAPELAWQNDTSDRWFATLEHVWEFLAGDESQYFSVSQELAAYLSSPLNHNEGQDGPDDFDRPQIVAAYSAALATIAWGVDFALTAIAQIFEAVDLKYGGDVGSEERRAEVEREIAYVRRVVTAVVRSEPSHRPGIPVDLLAAIRP